MGFQPVALSRSNSADYGMSLAGGVMAAYSWAPYGASYPMYPGMMRICPRCTKLLEQHGPGCRVA